MFHLFANNLCRIGKMHVKYLEGTQHTSNTQSHSLSLSLSGSGWLSDSLVNRLLLMPFLSGSKFTVSSVQLIVRACFIGLLTLARNSHSQCTVSYNIIALMRFCLSSLTTVRSTYAKQTYSRRYYINVASRRHKPQPMEPYEQAHSRNAERSRFTNTSRNTHKSD